MLIKWSSERKKGIVLHAFTYEKGELAALQEVLKAVGAVAEPLRDEAAPKDRRPVSSFLLPEFAIQQFEEHLGLRFEGEDRESLSVLPAAGGQRFRCDRVDGLSADPVNCVNLSASSRPDAVVKCALIANQRNWFGGIASPGACERAVGLTGMVRRLFRRARG